MIQNITSKAERLLNKTGNTRYCPICEHSFRRFEKFGRIPRRDAKCIHCGALERHRLFWVYLRQRSSFFSDLPRKFLHVAPERLFERKFRELLGSESYLTADLYRDGVDVKMDITDIKFDDHTFDFIYCSHVLEHVPDDLKAMKEFHRVLTRDGTAILLVPITTTRTYEDPSVSNSIDREALYGQHDHVRRYGPDYADRLRDAGFHVAKITRKDLLDEHEIKRLGITKAAGEIFVCTK